MQIIGEKAYGNLLLFNKLHRLHRKVRFSHTVKPPLDRGVI